MVRRNVLFAAVGLVLVGVIGSVVYESTHPTGPSRVAQIVACLKRLGYSTSVAHDDGTEDQCFFDLCKTVQVRPPTTEVTASVPGGLTLTVDVPDGGGAAHKYLHFPGTIPQTVPQTARRAAARCAEIA